jgi:hypothetical protein
LRNGFVLAIAVPRPATDCKGTLRNGFVRAVCAPFGAVDYEENMKNGFVRAASRCSRKGSIVMMVVELDAGRHSARYGIIAITYGLWQGRAAINASIGLLDFEIGHDLLRAFRGGVSTSEGVPYLDVQSAIWIREKAARSTFPA